MRKAITAILILILPAAIFAGSLFGELGIGYRTLGDSALRDVYGTGSMNFSLGVGTKVAPCFTVLFDAGYYTNSGKTLGLGEKTTLSYIPFLAKARYNFKAGESLRPYVGVGLGYIAYKVKNESEGLENVSKGAFGFQPEAGLCYKFQEKVGAIVNLGYLYAKAKPFDTSRNIGGVLISVGIRAKF